MKGKTLRYADSVAGKALYNLFSGVKEPVHENSDVLAIKLWALGESVLVLPTLRQLHDRGHKITVLCTDNNKAIFDGLPFVDRVRVFDYSPAAFKKNLSAIHNLRCGVAVDFEPFAYASAVMTRYSGSAVRVGFENRPRFYNRAVQIHEKEHAVRNFVNLGKEVEPLKYPEKLEPLYVSEANKKWAKSYLKPLGKVVGIHAGSSGSSVSRRWPEERFAKLCDRLDDAGFVPLLIGVEKELNEKIKEISGAECKIAPTMSIRRFVALLSELDLFVGNDSGPMHMSATMGTPTVGLFGPNSPERYGPYGPETASVYKGGPICVRPFRREFPECGHDHMERISVDDVLDAIQQLL